MRLNSICCGYYIYGNAGGFQTPLSFTLVGGGHLTCIKYYQVNIYVLN